MCENCVMSEYTTVTLKDRANLKTTSRYKTDEGFLRAPASLTRSGIIEYKARELGIKDGDPDRVVKLLRKPEHVFNDSTKQSIRGISLTVSHPKGVTPNNWERTNVGNVVGEPYRVGDMLMGEILIGSKRGIDMVEKEGWEELSIGYSFDFKSVDAPGKDYEFETTGPLIVNHVAIVEQGRAGSKVRIHDQNRGSKQMNETEISNLISDALDKREKAEKQKAADSDETKKMIAQTVVDSLAVALPKMLEDMGMKKKKDMGKKELDEGDEGDGGNAGKPKRGQKLPWDGKKDSFISDRLDAIAGDADANTVAEAKNLASAFLKDEMERISLMKKVSGLLSDEQKTKLATAPAKDILVAALGDSVSDAENKSVDYLLGIADMIQDSNTETPAPNNLFQLPSVGNARDGGIKNGVAGRDEYGEITKEYDSYANDMSEMWMDADLRESNQR